MNTNINTVTKLNEALNSLILAYEKLQKQNNEIQEEKDNLQKELLFLKNEKDNLTSNMEELNENTVQQDNNINSMLGKIESLLGVEDLPKEEIKIVSTDKSQEVEAKAEDNIFNVQVNTIEEPVQRSNSLENLDRMETFLSGFNKS